MSKTCNIALHIHECGQVFEVKLDVLTTTTHRSRAILCSFRRRRMFLVSANVRLRLRIMVQKNRPACADKSASTVVPVAQHGQNENQSIINKTTFKVKR